MQSFKKYIGILVILFAVGIWTLSYGVLSQHFKKTSFEGDESWWISVGYYYTNLVLNRDLDAQKWDCLECNSFGWLNPHLGKLLIGLPLVWYNSQNIFWAYDFSISYKENEKQGRVPPQHILTIARAAATFWGAGCCMLVFVIGYFAFNIWVGLVAVCLLLFNYVFVETVTSAMTDPHYNFFLLCVCFCIFFFMLRQRALGLLSILCGFFSGLAGSVKITGILICWGSFLCALIFKKIAYHIPIKKAVEYAAAFILSGVTVIYVLNPCFWPSLNSIRYTVAIQEFTEFCKNERTIISDRQYYLKRYPQLSNLSRIAGLPLMFMRWQKFLKNIEKVEMRRPGYAAWLKHRVRAHNKNLFIGFGTIPWEVILFCAGFLSLLSKTVFYRDGRSTLILSFFLVNYMFIMLFMRLVTIRYYLPTLIMIKIIAAYGICMTVATLRRLPDLVRQSGGNVNNAY